MLEHIAYFEKSQIKEKLLIFFSGKLFSGIPINISEKIIEHSWGHTAVRF